MAQNRHLILTTLFLGIFFILFYVYEPTNPYHSTSSKKNDSKEKQLEIKPVSVKKSPTVCDKVDISWLASDRKYWDGWSDKAMFIKADGTFTQGNVYIKEGEEICIVVLLGPTPAKASIKDETDHIGPRDSIAMFANGVDAAKVTVQLQQHERQLNAYYSATKFLQADTYHLRVISEYRTYFWESPVLHAYRPHEFTSSNKLIVLPQEDKQTNPLCDLENDGSDLSGVWVDTSAFKASHSEEFYISYENAEDNYSINNKVFIPNDCTLKFKSNGEGAQCLGKKVVHVLGDNNVRRNLKALKAGKNWCNLEEIRKIDDKEERNEKLKCGCNDDNEDPNGSLYPWVNDRNIPLQISNSWDVDSQIYFNHIQSTIVHHQQEIIQSIEDFANNKSHPAADVVIVGLGNADIEAIQISPIQFISSFKHFLTHLRQEIYPNQKIIVKTPQYFCCGTIWSTSWNTGRSLSFTITVRDTVRSFGDENMLLWDVHSLGTDETTCLQFGGSSYSKRNIVNVENLILWNLICEA